jgi:hypothetical protein
MLGCWVDCGKWGSRGEVKTFLQTISRSRARGGVMRCDIFGSEAIKLGL